MSDDDKPRKHSMISNLLAAEVKRAESSFVSVPERPREWPPPEAPSSLIVVYRKTDVGFLTQVKRGLQIATNTNRQEKKKAKFEHQGNILTIDPIKDIRSRGNKGSVKTHFRSDLALVALFLQFQHQI